MTSLASFDVVIVKFEQILLNFGFKQINTIFKCENNFLSGLKENLGLFFINLFHATDLFLSSQKTSKRQGILMYLGGIE